ncbi:chromatin assembly factor 1 subunit B isoform X1 [Strongylocentrotus purpuratus]|uniref:CAF1B/HIR1 beta-propeller domain-containing protein n=2 Tax=Strongylocentrotus purpuratus TaxID=7668 RepID=A0A7M7PI08_STRPU|nr:chromatin assembly factor 1 subunit B isoform X1 [Strongylocentrotus purpuratus]
MKVETPEISWHGRDPVYSADFQPGKRSLCRIATASTDTNVLVWYVSVDNDGKAQPTFAASLSRHTKAVNVVRFSPDGETLASGADDGLVILWKLQEIGYVAAVFGKEDEDCKETWATLKTLRGHLEDVYDISWSSDGSRMISGSVDNSAIIWDTQKGEKLFLLKDHRSFVQGVAWDPKDRFCATISCDRSMRVYNLSNNRCIHHVNKLTLAAAGNNGEGVTKQYRMFHDDTMKSFFRRLAFSPDGELLIVPAGILEIGDSVLNTTYVFSTSSFSKPVLHLPCPTKATIAVRCCPVLFEFRQESSDADSTTATPEKKSESTQQKAEQKDEPMETDAAAPNTSPESKEEGQEKSDSSKEVQDKSASSPSKPETKPETKDQATQLFDLPYRMVFAVATEDSLLLYDTQQSIPFGLISNIHYHQLSDVTWSSDGRILAVSSTDGYCSFVTFEAGELGVPYVSQPVPTTAPNPAPPSATKSSPSPTPAVSIQTLANQNAGISKSPNQNTGISKSPNQQSVSTGVAAGGPASITVKPVGGNRVKEAKRITPVMISGPPGSGPAPRRIQLTTLSSPPSNQPTNSSSSPPSSSSSTHQPSKEDHPSSSSSSSNQTTDTPSNQRPSQNGGSPVTAKDTVPGGSHVTVKDTIPDEAIPDEEEDDNENEDVIDLTAESDSDEADEMEVKEEDIPVVPMKKVQMPQKPVAPAPRRMTTIKLLSD